MKTERFIYNLNYPANEKGSCELEVRSLFQLDLKEKVFFETRKVHPSVSPFLKNRLEIIFQASTFSEIIESIIIAKIAAPDFMVKYVELEKDDRRFKKRREYCKAIGLIIEGFPCYTAPKNTFGITFYKGNWYFGKLAERSPYWKAHNKKPNAYSSSLDLNTAKVLINIAGNGDISKRLIDPCCGVGTVLLEGVWAGYDITGWEINSKVAESARENLRHFNYDVTVITGDIQDIEDSFDASIVDLPYGNFSFKNDENQLKIIRNAKRISNKIVLVSSEDIREELVKENLKIIDHCRIGKKTKGAFMRYIWVCDVDQ
jgi:tRNA G10  N-methylase Trm11